MFETKGPTKMKKNKKLILGLILLASFFCAHQFTKTDQEKISDTSKTHQQRTVASPVVAPTVETKQQNIPSGLVVLDKIQFTTEAQKDNLSFEEFKSRISEISKSIGWDLVVEITPDGNTHIKNKQITQDFGTLPLAAYTDEEWAVQEENYISLVNNSNELNLTRDDQMTLEKWKQGN